MVLVLAGCGSDARAPSTDPAPAAPKSEAEQDKARVEQLRRDLAASEARLEEATTAVANAGSDGARADAKDRLERLRRERAQLEKQIAQAERARDVPTGAPSELEAARQTQMAAERSVLDAQAAAQAVAEARAELARQEVVVLDAVDAVAAAKSDADRAAAKARLEEARAKQAELEAKVQKLTTAAIEADRVMRAKISPRCLEDPKAPGCT